MSLAKEGKETLKAYLKCHEDVKTKFDKLKDARDAHDRAESALESARGKLLKYIEENKLKDELLVQGKTGVYISNNSLHIKEIVFAD